MFQHGFLFLMPQKCSNILQQTLAVITILCIPTNLQSVASNNKITCMILMYPVDEKAVCLIGMQDLSYKPRQSPVSHGCIRLVLWLYCWDKVTVAGSLLWHFDKIYCHRFLASGTIFGGNLLLYNLKFSTKYNKTMITTPQKYRQPPPWNLQEDINKWPSSYTCTNGNYIPGVKDYEHKYHHYWSADLTRNYQSEQPHTGIIRKKSLIGQMKENSFWQWLKARPC